MISGPDDLRELRAVVEAITGAGTWPFAASEPPPTGLRLTSTVELDRLGSVLGFVAALEGRIEDRTGAWRTWRTVVDSVAAVLPTPFGLTIDAVVVSGELAE